MKPTWAKDLEEDEFDYPLKPRQNSKDNDHSDTDSINKDEELLKLRQKIEELESKIVSQAQQLNSISHMSSPSTTSTGITSIESTVATKLSIPNNPYSKGLELIDLVKNFNILYTSKRNTKNQFPIIYQISVMSWLFIIKNDTYLNDLWIKIFNLRKYYEQQSSITEGNDSTKKILELSKQTNNFITNIKNSSSTFVTKTESEQDFNPIDFNNPNPSQSAEECPVTKKVGQCPMDFQPQEAVSLKRPHPDTEEEEKCPVTGSVGKCPVQHPDSDSLSLPVPVPLPKSKLVAFKKLNPPLAPLSNLQCPMIRHNDGLKQLASEARCPMLNTDLAKFAEDEDNEDSKVCPLMIGDARNLFRERLLNFSSGSQEQTITNTNGCPVIGCDPFPSKRRKNNSKKIKAVLVPMDIRAMNFTNSKEVIAVFEKYLPTKKVAWLLINRFFDKLYLHIPIVDEYSFRERISKIIGDKNSASGQKIKLGGKMLDYNEDFLNLCLAIIVMRLSWLTLPSNLPKKFSQTGKDSQELTLDEKVLIKPENMIPMVLIDLIKEIFTDVRILTTPSVIILQVGMFLKYYNVLAPEDGFELDDSYNGSGHSNGVSPDKEALNLNSSVFLNSLISLAKTIGLNRDPLTFKNFQSSSKDESVNIHMLRRRHLWRKMWYTLINLNVLTNISLGDYSKHLNIEIDDNNNEQEHGDYMEYWDTKKPSVIEGEMFQKCFPDYNGKTDLNYKRELKVVHLMDMEYKINVLIYRGMKILLNIKSLPLKLSVDAILDQLTQLVHDESEDGQKSNSGLTCDDLLTRFDKNRESELSASARIFKFKLFLIVKMLMFVLNYILFLNYELKLKQLISENGLDLRRVAEDPVYLQQLDPHLVQVIELNKKFYNQYFERALLLAIDNYNIFVQFFDNSNKFFPNMGGELLIYPFLMILNHRSKQFIISLVLRLQQNDPLISQIMVQSGINKDELLSKLFGYLKIFLSKLDKLTKHYYYAWRLKKLMKFFYNVLISSSKIFTSQYTKMLAKTDGSIDQCPVLQDIQATSVPVLPNQRKKMVVPKVEPEFESRLPAPHLEPVDISPSMYTPVDGDLQVPLPHEIQNAAPTSVFGQAPSLFASQVLNGITGDLEKEFGVSENRQFDLWDEIMLDNFPINGTNTFSTPVEEFFGNEVKEEINYGANEIDLTNVDLNTLTNLNLFLTPNHTEQSTADGARHQGGWYNNL